MLRKQDKEVLFVAFLFQDGDKKLRRKSTSWVGWGWWMKSLYIQRRDGILDESPRRTPTICRQRQHFGGIRESFLEDWFFKVWYFPSDLSDIDFTFSWWACFRANITPIYLEIWPSSLRYTYNSLAEREFNFHSPCRDRKSRLPISLERYSCTRVRIPRSQARPIHDMHPRHPALFWLFVSLESRIVCQRTDPLHEWFLFLSSAPGQWLIANGYYWSIINHRYSYFSSSGATGRLGSCGLGHLQSLSQRRKTQHLGLMRLQLSIVLRCWRPASSWYMRHYGDAHSCWLTIMARNLHKK